MRDFHHCRHTYNFSLAEKHLCYQNSPEKVNESHSYSQLFYEHLERPLGKGKNAVINGLKDWWAGKESAEKKKELSKVVEFFTSAPPRLQFRVEQTIREKSLNAEEISQLADHSAWMEAFKYGNFDEAPMQLQDGQAASQAMNVFRSLDAAQRRELYFEYVNWMLGAKVMKGDKHDALLGHAGNEPSMRTNACIRNREAILNSIGLMLGSEDPAAAPADSPAKKLAEDALRHRFFNEGDEEKGYTENFKMQYLRAWHANRDRTSAQTLVSSDVLPPMFLKGAIRMGVVDDGHLKELRGALGPIDEADARRAEVVRQSTREVQDLAKVSLREARERAGGAGKVWDKLPAWQKLVLVGGAIYVGMKAKGLAVGLGAIYFGAKFLGIKTPVESSFKFGKEMMEMVPFGKGILHGQQVDSREIERNAEAMARFLDDNARERLRSSVTGFTLLSYVPVSLLAQHFEPGPPPKFLLTDALRIELREIFKNRGMDRSAIETFFDFCTGRPQEFSEALLTVFFVAGSRLNDPEIREDEALIQRELDAMPAGERDITTLLHKNPPIMLTKSRGEEFPLPELYFKVATRGQESARLMGSTTLLDFVMEVSGVPAAVDGTKPAKQEQRIEKKDFFKQRDAVLAARHGPYVKLDIQIQIEKDHVTLVSQQNVDIARIPLQQFYDTDPKTIFDKYIVWCGNDAMRKKSSNPLQ